MIGLKYLETVRKKEEKYNNGFNHDNAMSRNLLMRLYGAQVSRHFTRCRLSQC